MAETLLTTKYRVPALRHHVVRRPRLDDQFQRVLDVPLTLVSAPPGFGKTTAVLAAIRRLAADGGIASGWLSLDAHDQEPVRFWRYVLAALQRASNRDLPFATEPSQLQPAAIEALLVELLNALADHPAPIILVLDDFHLADQPDIHAGLSFMVEHAPPNLHLVLVTRADPPWPLHRLRARGQLVEIRTADLRFDSPEAAAFLTSIMSLTLSQDEVTRLVQQTEGWAAGLQLAGLALQGEPLAATGDRRLALIDRLAQTNRYILDYLTEEVLLQQPPALQSFLLQTSIVNPLCGPLCDAVTGGTGSADILADLSRRNLFVVPLTPTGGADGQGWYRYHQLFADLLQGQLLRQQPAQVPDLHRRAAAWYESQDDLEAAIDHALHAGDYARAVRLLDAGASALVMQGRIRTLEGWLHRLPDNWRQQLTRASIAFAWALLIRGEYQALDPYLSQAEQSIPADDRRLWGEFHALKATVADTLGRADEALVHAQQAIEHAAPDETIIQAIAHVALGGARRTQGDVHGAAAAYEQAVPLCSAANLPLPALLSRAHLGYLYGVLGRLRQAEAITRPVLESAYRRHPSAAAALAALGDVWYEWNRLDDTASLIQQAFELTGRSGHRAVVAQLHMLRARLYRAHGDGTAAQRDLDQAAALIGEGVPAWIEPLLIAERVYLWLDQGMADAADALLREHMPRRELYVGHIRDVLPLAHAWTAYHQGRCADARSTLDALIAGAEAAGCQGRVIEGRLLRALVNAAQGDQPAALRDLAQALTLAEPEGYVRLFVAGGAPAAALLASDGSGYARELLAHFSPDVRQQAADHNALPEPLTAREQEVLRLMARGLTYQQIADELVVSINTVRHHVKGAYGKLGVDKRTPAIEKARALQLL